MNIDKRHVYELVEKAVTPDVMELCSHDARAEVIDRVSKDAFGFYAFAIEPTDEQYDMLNLLDDMIIDVMACKGYELEPGELASRTIECFDFDGSRYSFWYDHEDMRYILVRKSDDGWLASENNMAHVTAIGRGDTPQHALNNMRMVRAW